MSQTSRKEILHYVLLVIFVLLTRVPFLSHGYGIDGDSWSVAITANNIHNSGIYEASRLPGYPIHEYLGSIFVKAGPIGLNGLTAVFSCIAVLFFALTLRALRFKQIFLASITFSMVPVFYIQSTTTIDYVIAMGFIMAAMYALFRDKLILSGILLGLAIGARITSGAMLIPFSILLVDNEEMKESIKRIMRLIGPALITGLFFFVPVIATYGPGFFTYYDVPYPSIAKVLYKLSIEVWGVVGFLGLLISTGLLFLTERITQKKFLFPRAVNEKFVIAWLVAIDLYIIAFLKLPMESGYLIPIIPFVIMLFGKYLYNRAFIFFCGMLILSAWTCTISPRERFDAVTPSGASFSFSGAGEKLYFDVLKGPVISYETRRKNGIDFVDELLESFDTITTKSVIVSGKWYNQLFVQRGDTVMQNAVLVDYLQEDKAVYYYAKGYMIYYLPKQDFYNKIMRKVDLDIYKALPYIRDDRN